MGIEIKMINSGSFIGYVLINNIRIYAFESSDLETNINGLQEWIVVRKLNTTYFY